ncbi:MAG: ribosome small subunit-dependent GTPase A [Firmicutes bacterium]|nr:ribosome small subunit-dependent GTPase A [Bacillota bacterium]
MRGLVLKGIGGFYFVETEVGIFRAKARGVFKKERNLLMVGDEVEIAVSENAEEDSWITDILPRKNSFLRPPISNIDMLMVVFAVANPEPNFVVIDKMLAMTERKGIEPIVCINKADLANAENLDRITKVYERIYRTFVTNAKTEDGIAKIREAVCGYKVALAGPSGVGKSTIVNALVPGSNMEIGEISDKTSRGRHTTRHVEMIHLGNGYVFDTPGFTSLDLDNDIEARDIAYYYPELRRASENCKFSDCMHINEHECGVKTALFSGEVSKERYVTYLGIVEELRERGKKYE